MRKRLAVLLLSAAAALALCGCGSLFEKEYVYIADYAPAVQDGPSEGERVTVRNLEELKQAILNQVAEGKEESSVYFDTDYEGRAAEDLSSACWQLRTQDALCAYCVENISYELNKIVAYFEARVSVDFSDVWPGADRIVKMQYSTGLEETVKDAIQRGETKLVVLVNRSSYSAENMENIVSRVYRKYPASAPKEPKTTVKMFSGTGLQRLYEINISYGLSAGELELRRGQMAEVDPFAELDPAGMGQAELALEACRYLVENCSYTDDAQYNDIYSALVRRQANGEGLAFAYAELCRRLGINCQIVYGQLSWEDYSWNIVRIDGEYYHVDLGRCIASGLESGFLLSDQALWDDHRWDVSAYPRCTGTANFDNLENLDETG